MKIYEIKLKPTSFFITPIQGDTLFGCLCWQLHNIGADLDNLLNDYSSNPFMVVSSGFFLHEEGFIFPKPLCPDFYMFKANDNQTDYKANKKKKFFRIYKDEVIITNELPFEEELKDFAYNTQQAHNSINRMTGTTDSDGEFAPFYTPSIIYDTKGFVVVFAAIEERISKETLKEIFENLGKTGYGKKASSGYGHFEVISCEESSLWKNDFSDCNALYTLAPFVLSETEITNIKECFFQPITKYGKHGGDKALSEKPFKKPVIMADMASIISFKGGINTNKPYIGTAIEGTSYIDNKTVMQGYALCLPCKLEEAK